MEENKMAKGLFIGFLDRFIGGDCSFTLCAEIR